MMETLTASVGLFQNNPDIIPGTRTFDKDLADRFVELAKPYEMRIDDKLVGYNVPVQPLLTQLRQQVMAARATAPQAAAQPTAQQQRAANQDRTPAGQFSQPDGPQAGIQSKAGSSDVGEDNDFSALFGTIGMPNFRI